MTIQSQYNRYQQIGYPGQCARPHAPITYDQGQVGVAVETGQGVLFDDATERFVLPTSAAERLEVTHIVGYDVGTVQSTVATPTGANSDQAIAIAADKVIRAAEEGHFYVTAGATLKYDLSLIHI